VLHRNRFIFKSPTSRTNYPNLVCYKIPHVSGIFSAHHQEISIVHSALVSFMQVSDDRFQEASGWNCNSILTLPRSGHLHGMAGERHGRGMLCVNRP
jgi:hypothetical protein